MEFWNLIVMILVGALSGTLAAKIVRNDMSWVVSAVLRYCWSRSWEDLSED